MFSFPPPANVEFQGGLEVTCNTPGTVPDTQQALNIVATVIQTVGDRRTSGTKKRKQQKGNRGHSLTGERGERGIQLAVDKLSSYERGSGGQAD